MMDRFYCGWSNQKNHWEVFGWDLREEPTLDDTGYDDLSGPYDTKEEAEENC